ncbi:MAG: hypothetical protein HFG58_15845 [Lachnospiraceae bacterium]|nr:hypothetical protein [Lachnospiraceae bacterium]
MPEFILDSSFVMCSCARKPPAGLDRLDTECFEYYRILHATEENNGIFGNDSPFIRDIDCEPYIHMDPFKGCQSDHYITALETIAWNTYRVMQAYEPGSAQYAALRDKYLRYQENIEFARQQGDIPREYRNYPCVLELLDRWFETDDLVRITNVMTVLSRVREVQAGYAVQIQERLSEWGNTYSCYERKEKLGIWGDYWIGTPVPMTEADKTVSEIQGFFYPGHRQEEEKRRREAEEKRRREAEEKREEQEAWREVSGIKWEADQKVRSFIQKLEGWIKEEVSEAGRYQKEEEIAPDGKYLDEFERITGRLRQLKESAREAAESIRDLITVAKNYGLGSELEPLEQFLKESEESFQSLLREIQGLREQICEYSPVTENSFLVCRCGGHIRVVKNGSWVADNRETLVPNIVDLLLFAENYLYDLQNPNLNRDIRFSIIKAFNIVHGGVLCLGGEGVSNLDYIIDEECEKSGKPAAHVEIKVRPMQELLKEERIMDAAKNGIGLAGGELVWVGVGMTFMFSFGDLIANLLEEKYVETEEKFNLVNLGISTFYNGYQILVGKRIEIIDELASGYFRTISIVSIVEDLLYKSYAAFIGEIKVIVTTFHEQYEFSGKFDIKGNKEGKYRASKKAYFKSPFLTAVPEDNKTTLNFRIYEDGIFKNIEESGFMY